MTLLPIVERELRAVARRPVTYSYRMLTALVAIGLGTFVLVSSDDDPRNVGLGLFGTLTGCAFSLCLMAGLGTADNLSEERRQGTLGLLFLTDLKGHDVVLGKLASSSIHLLFALLAVLPVLGVSFLFGGVSGVQLGRTAVALGLTLLQSLALGMFVSLWCGSGRRAAVCTCALLVLQTVVPGLVFLPIFGISWTPGQALTPGAWVWLSPGFLTLLGAMGDTPSRGYPTELFWPSAAWLLGQALLLLGLASWLLPRLRDESVLAPFAGGFGRAISRWGRGGTLAADARRRSRRLRFLERNPFLWLADRDRFPGSVWMLLGASGLFVLVMARMLSTVWPHVWPSLLPMVSFGVHAGLKIWMVFAAIRRIADDRQSGALELLLTTPLGVDRLGQGVRAALVRQFGGPILLLLVANAVLCRVLMEESYQVELTMVLLFAMHMALLVFDAATIAMVGPWAAVSRRRPLHAIAWTCLWILITPWLVLFVVSAGSEFLRVQYGVIFDLSEEASLLSWFGLNAANNLIWTAVARRRWRERFRDAAAERFGPAAKSGLGRAGAP